ncbi:putative ribonuclease H-like domain-containing protein, partial [Tanacetum coccineum]
KARREIVPGDNKKKVTKEPGKEGGDPSNEDDRVNNTNNINTAGDGNNTNNANAVSSTVNTVGIEVNVVGAKTSIELPDDPNMPELKYIVYSYDYEDIGAEADTNNLNTFMPDELLQFKLQKVWTLVDLPNGKRAIGTKWVFRNKKDKRGIVIKNKSRIEAIRLFLTYASFKDIVVYQMDVNSSFLNDDIIFGSTKKSLCIKFNKMMHKKFQMSSIGELTFFLGLQVKQKEDGIFISQDKYVTEILKKFGFTNIKTASTPMETQNPLLKDEDGEEVDVHLYRSMIGSLMYLTSSRLDIMFTMCACVRYQVNPKVSHLYVVKRIFRYLKGQHKLGLWYPKDSPFDLVAYTDCDYTRASLDRKSTTGGCYILGCRLVSWQCKKQTVVANSTTEAKYVAALSCCGQVLWIQNQLLDYGFSKLLDPHHNTLYIIQPSTSQPSKKQKPRKPKRKDTEVPQPSGPIENVEDEVVYEEMDDNLERATTTATSLDAEQIGHQETIGDTIAQTGFESVSKLSNDPLLARVIDLEKTKTSQAQEITSLKRKRLEKKGGSKTHGLKRLYNVGLSRRVESSEDKDMFGVHDLVGDEVVVETEVASKDANLSVDEVTLAQALVALKSAKPKADKVMLQGPEQEQVPTPTVSSQQPSQLNVQDKGFDYQMAQQMQAEEQEELSIKEKSKLFVQLLEARKKHFAATRAQEKRNKAPTKAQKRNTMSTYLKNMAVYKNNQLKNKSFDDI